MVRKSLTALLTAVLIMSVTVISAFAACDGRGRNYADSNNDGICDNYNANAGNGRRNNFVDSDGDGICDNYGLNGGTGNCTGSHGRHGMACSR